MFSKMKIGICELCFSIADEHDYCHQCHHYILREYTFHGYKVFSNGIILGKNGLPLKKHLRKRNGGKFDHRVSLYINKKMIHFTVQRLIASCFLGPTFGYEVNHKDRDTLNNRLSNLELVTASENQKHWRNCELGK